MNGLRARQTERESRLRHRGEAAVGKTSSQCGVWHLFFLIAVFFLMYRFKVCCWIRLTIFYCRLVTPLTISHNDELLRGINLKKTGIIAS